MSDLDAIEARANAASDGPWIVVHEPAWEADGVQHPDVIKVGAPLYVGDDEPVTVCLVSTDYEDDPVDVLGDAEFIAHARTDVPALVALVRAKESWIDGAKVDMAALEEAAAKATTWHMEALDDLAACVAERDDARAEADRLTGALGAIAALPSASKPVRDIARDALLDVRHDPSATTDPQSASVSPEEALTVRCGTCDADPGEACVTVGPWPGRVQRYPHESRYGKAREARPSATTDGGAP